MKSSNENVLVISAHPDDETLGCGGTLLNHKSKGDQVSWMIVTDPYEPIWSTDLINTQETEIKKVSEAYGFEDCIRLRFKSAMLDTIPQADLMQHIRDGISHMKVSTVYLVNGGDVHSDHEAVFAATMSVLKPFHMLDLGVKRILAYETLSSTEAAPANHARQFVPSVFSDITHSLEQKIDIFEIYRSEAQGELFPRNASALRALARLRGATIGVEYGEAFAIVRELI